MVVLQYFVVMFKFCLLKQAVITILIIDKIVLKPILIEEHNIIIKEKSNKSILQFLEYVHQN